MRGRSRRNSCLKRSCLCLGRVLRLVWPRQCARRRLQSTLTIFENKLPITPSSSPFSSALGLGAFSPGVSPPLTTRHASHLSNSAALYSCIYPVRHIMTDLPIVSAFSLSAVSVFPSAKCLQFSQDGQVLLLTKHAVHILVRCRPSPGNDRRHLINHPQDA